MPLHMLRAAGSFPKLLVARRDYLQEIKPEERDYYTCIVCESVNELCVLTVGQSNCPRWQKERKVRVSSTSAHTILRTHKGPEAILSSLLNDNFFSSVATAYGMPMEPVAREEFEKQHGITVTEVGLLVHPQQPWLCGSTDGIFSSSSETCLLEIKCPFKCNDRQISDEQGKSILDYVHNVDGAPTLRKSHWQSVNMVITRGDAFLQESIPTLEEFYFVWILPELVKRQIL